MKLNEIVKHYKVCYRHNPKHFYPDTLEVESINGKLFLIGRPLKSLKKNLRVIAILKKKV